MLYSGSATDRTSRRGLLGGSVLPCHDMVFENRMPRGKTDSVEVQGIFCEVLQVGAEVKEAWLNGV